MQNGVFVYSIVMGVMEKELPFIRIELRIDVRSDLMDHRVHRGRARHRKDPRSPGWESARARSFGAAAEPSAAPAGAVRLIRMTQ